MSTTEASAVAKPGTAEIDVAWSDLGFEFRPTKSHLKMTWTEEKGWGAAELVDSPYVNLHIGATALHYGQSCFEGLKAFAHEDDSVHIFRPDENANLNFVGIDNDAKKYVTPKSPSVLPSITNKSLMQIAADEGFEVERRDIPVEEMERFDEVLAVGTAVVVTPIGSATRLEGDGETVKAKYQFSEEVGTTTRKLYDIVRGIQSGEMEDKRGWNFKVE